MKTLCLYGCGGMGREIADLAQRLGIWESIIFIDDNKSNIIVDGIKVITFDELLECLLPETLEFIVTTGEPVTREMIYTKLEKKGLNCTRIFYPGFNMSLSSSIGKGTIVHSGAIVTCNVHIGRGCLINKHVVIGHDVSIGDYCVISPNVTIGGNTEVSKNCFIGSGAVIRNGITIGENSIIGMGAVVLNNVMPNSVMVGNPARLLRENTDKKVFNT